MTKYILLSLMLLSGCARISDLKSQNNYQPTAQDKKLYDASQCTGPIVFGVCHGMIIPNGNYHPTCHGSMIGGICTGPLF